MRHIFLNAFFLLGVVTLVALPSVALNNQRKYQDPSIQNLSKLYWALGAMDYDNNEQVDNYMLINECDIYQDYKYNEFEWESIRKSAREMLRKSVPLFSTRFRIMQEIKLTEYDSEKGGFYIEEESRLDSSKRFEVVAADNNEEICGIKREIEYYPRSLMIELSRPFELSFIPVHKSVAQAFIEERLEGFRNLDNAKQNFSNLYAYRTAYIEAKVKIFSYTGTRYYSGNLHADTVGVLESVKIYGDRERKNLLYAKTMGQRIKSDTIDPNLKKQFEAFLARREKMPIDIVPN